MHPFALSRADDAVKAIAGAGTIMRCERLPTGRFNILLRGESRVRIEREVPTDTLYRMVIAAPLADVGGDRPGLASLARGHSGITMAVIDALLALIEHEVFAQQRKSHRSPDRLQIFQRALEIFLISQY